MDTYLQQADHVVAEKTELQSLDEKEWTNTQTEMEKMYNLYITDKI